MYTAAWWRFRAGFELTQLLGAAGWFAKHATKASARPPRPPQARGTLPADTTDSPRDSPTIPAVRPRQVAPLDLAALRSRREGEAAAPVPHWLSSFSTSRSDAQGPLSGRTTWTDAPTAPASAWGDTPRSWATAMSVAESLPQVRVPKSAGTTLGRSAHSGLQCAVISR